MPFVSSNKIEMNGHTFLKGFFLMSKRIPLISETLKSNLFVPLSFNCLKLSLSLQGTDGKFAER